MSWLLLLLLGGIEPGADISIGMVLCLKWVYLGGRACLGWLLAV